MARTADVHNHVIPLSFVERVRKDGARYGWTVRDSEGGVEEVVPGDGHGMKVFTERSDPVLRRDQMEAAGIDIAMQSFSPNLAFYSADKAQAEWSARNVNDSMAEDMQKFPDNVLSMGYMPMQFPSMAVDELERVTAMGMPAIQIGSHVGERKFDDPYFFEFWAAAERLGTLIFIHPYKPVVAEWLPKYHLRNVIGNPLETSIAVATLIFGGVLERYPNLKFVFAHAGGYAPWIRGRWRHGMEERSEARDSGALREFDEYFKLLYFDSLIHDAKAFNYLIESVGTDRILLGTDYPADMGSWNQQVASIRSLASVSETDKDKMLGGNALRLIGWDS